MSRTNDDPSHAHDDDCICGWVDLPTPLLKEKLGTLKATQTMVEKELQRLKRDIADFPGSDILNTLDTLMVKKGEELLDRFDRVTSKILKLITAREISQNN